MKTHNTPNFGSLDNIKEDEEDGQCSDLADYTIDINSSVDTVFEKDPEIPVLTMKRCGFSWGTDESLLSVSDLSFPRGKVNYMQIHCSNYQSLAATQNFKNHVLLSLLGQLTIIVGKTGSGKTSLLLGMLGEIQRTIGSIQWAK